MARLRRFALVLTLAASTLAPALQAEPLRLQRGVNGDLWYDWRPIAELIADPTYLDIFPDWRRVTTPRMFELLAEEGFDFIRLPIDPGPALAYGPGPDRDRLIDGIRTGAEFALDAGLNVIVDLHPLSRGDEVGGADSIVGSHWPDYVALVGQIGARLNGLPPDRVAFELLNEPAIDCEGVYAGVPPIWPDMQAELHAAARAAAPDLTLILTGACYGPVVALATLDPTLIPDDNVIWTFHSYGPSTYTHQGAIWIDPPVKYLWDVPYPPSLMTPEIAAKVVADAVSRMTAAEGAADVDAITREVQAYADTPDSAVAEDIVRAAAWADAHGVPRSRLLMGEFGALHTLDGGVAQPRAWYHAFLADKRKAAEDAGMGWAVLSYSGGMGVAMIDDPERRLAPETCRALGLLCGN